jgi:hypothetical protein
MCCMIFVAGAQVPLECQMVLINLQQLTWTCPAGSVSRLNYNIDESMSAIIAPPGAASIALSFTAFATEYGYDYLTVLSCTTINCSAGSTSTLLYRSGSNIPGPITSTTGIMKLIWRSDEIITSAGWAATWRTIYSGKILYGPALMIQLESTM